MHDNYASEIDNLSSYDDLDPSYMCTLEEKEIVLSIQHAVNDFNNEPSTFSTFHTNITPEQQAILSQLNIRSLNTMFNYADLPNLYQQLTDFIKSLAMHDENDLLAPTAAKIITKLVHNIIDASGFTSAWVDIRSDIDPNQHGKYGAYSYIDKNNNLPAWHIDKHMAEMLYPHSLANLCHKQFNYLITLKGNSTLYYPYSSNIRAAFDTTAYDLTFTYGSDGTYNSSKIISKIISPDDFQSVDLGYGTMHIASKLHGVIHAVPYHHERLILIVIPEHQDILIQYYEFCKQIYNMREKL